eukprot:gene8934-9857_t
MLERECSILGQDGFKRIVQLEKDMAQVKADITQVKADITQVMADMVEVKAGIQTLLERPAFYQMHTMPSDDDLAEESLDALRCLLRGGILQQVETATLRYLADLNVEDYLRYMGMDFATNYLSSQI